MIYEYMILNGCRFLQNAIRIEPWNISNASEIPCQSKRFLSVSLLPPSYQYSQSSSRREEGKCCLTFLGHGRNLLENGTIWTSAYPVFLHLLCSKSPLHRQVLSQMVREFIFLQYRQVRFRDDLCDPFL